MELSHAEIRSLIAAALPQGEWIEDVYPSHVISQSADGQMHRRDYQIGADRAVALADAVAVRREVSYHRMFSFSVLPQAYSAVSRQGKLFEAQFFAERGMGVTEAELDEVIASFSGAPILIQHSSSIFDQLPADQRPGYVTRLWRKGRELFGEVRLAQWLNDLFADLPIKVSVRLSAERPRRLEELSLVHNPRITDAALFAAAQQFAQAGKGAGAAPHQAHTTPMSTFTPEDRSFLDKVKAFFGGSAGPAPDPVEQRFAALEAKIDALKPSQPAPPSPADHQADAAKFADQLIQAGRLLPVNRQQVVDGYQSVAPAGQAAIQAYCQAYASAPVHQLTAPAIPAQQHAAQSAYESDGTFKVTVGGKR